MGLHITYLSFPNQKSCMKWGLGTQHDTQGTVCNGLLHFWRLHLLTLFTGSPPTCDKNVGGEPGNEANVYHPHCIQAQKKIGHKKLSGGSGLEQSARGSHHESKHCSKFNHVRSRYVNVLQNRLTNL